MIRIPHSVCVTPGKSVWARNHGKLIDDANLQQEALGGNVVPNLDEMIRVLGDTLGYRFLHDLVSSTNDGTLATQPAKKDSASK